MQMGIRTRKDDDNGDADADGVIDVAHDGADERTSTQEKDKRALVKRLGKLKERGFWSRH